MAELGRCESLHSVRLLRELVRRWFGLDVHIAGSDGTPIAHADGRVIPAPNEVCRHALFSREGFRSCNQSYRAARGAIGAGTATATSVCHLGFDVMGAPIRVGETTVGSLFVSGLVADAPTEETRTRMADGIRRFDEGAVDLEPSLRSLPVVASSRRGELVDLLETTAADVGRFLADRVRPKAPPSVFEGIVGTAPAMQSLFKMLDKVVQSESTVLILGESGTGKELVAHAIHSRGPRKNRAFVAQNCSAITETLLESAMFGYVRGAFTGAVKDTKGLFEVADGGTFFLDEIGDMSPALQVKLLRVLQDGTFTPVGGTSERRVDVRVIAATNKDLATAVSKSEFREDLYYRLNVIRVTMPPLRERTEDIGSLVDHFLERHNRRREKPIRLSRAVRQALEEYPWPGNVRELENEIERLTVLGSGEDDVEVDLLSPRLLEVARERTSQPVPWRPSSPPGTLKQALEDLERQMIRDGLVRTGNNKSQLAKELGISRSNLIAKVQQYALDKDGSTRD